ncbi:MAG: aminopeptidase [Methanosarcinaceae archaeon]|nr:aminopeptidase [Methanosarcinaceae archaeon]
MTLKKSADMIIRTCMGAKPGESVLIVTDKCTDERIAQAFFDAAVDADCEALLLTMKPRTQHGEEPPLVVAEAMRSADVILAPTSKSITHTKARQNACKMGARAATLPGITMDMMTSGGMTADYGKMGAVAKEVFEALDGAQEIRVTTELGTDVVFDVEGCEWKDDTGNCTVPGSMSNLPAGELFVAPANVNGIVVIDGAMGGLGLLDKPIVIEVENGNAVRFSGKRADDLKTIIDRAGPDARNVAELGIGINPAARLIGVILEDEKVGGTVHMALGDNSTFGGNVSVELHLDGIITGPKVYVDGVDLRVERLAGSSSVDD